MSNRRSHRAIAPGVLPPERVNVALEIADGDWADVFRRVREGLHREAAAPAIWWVGADLNRRHQDFQSCALPLSYPPTGQRQLYQLPRAMSISNPRVPALTVLESPGRGA